MVSLHVLCQQEPSNVTDGEMSEQNCVVCSLATPSGAPPLPPLAVGQSSDHAALSGRWGGILGKTVQGVLNIEC